jgi:hypothetical protein
MAVPPPWRNLQEAAPLMDDLDLRRCLLLAPELPNPRAYSHSHGR